MGKAEKLKEQRKQEQEEKTQRRKKLRNNILVYSGIVIISFFVALSAYWIYQKLTSPKPTDEITEEKSEEVPESKNEKYSAYPEMTITEGHIDAEIETSEGIIKISLNANDAPKTVNSFVFLAKEGFYNNSTFHRVIPEFMIQGGDPLGDGTGGPGYQFEDENLENATYHKGAVCMANSGPNTNGSQFFVMHKDKFDLPKNYTVFGIVTEGMDVVDKIAAGQTEISAGGEQSKPVNPVKIIKITVDDHSDHGDSPPHQ